MMLKRLPPGKKLNTAAKFPLRNKLNSAAKFPPGKKLNSAAKSSVYWSQRAQCEPVWPRGKVLGW